MRALLRRIRGLFTRGRAGREIDAELASHLDLHIADKLRAGMTRAEARRDALLKLGGLTAAKEAYRDRSTLPLVENLALDLRFALRQWAKNPGFALTATIVLSLGICASTAIFMFVDAALLKPLPYREPARLVAVNESTTVFARSNISYFDYLDWKRLNKVFASLDVYTGAGYLLKTATGMEPVNAGSVSEGFFRTLGVEPLLGRTFRPGEDLPTSAQTVVLSYGLWQSRFGGDGKVLGQMLIMSGEQYMIIGVLPKDFQFAPRGEAELWTPLHAVSGCETRRSCHNLDGVARLKDGVSAQTASAEMKIIAQELERQYPDSNRGQSAIVEPLTAIVVGPLQAVLLTLMGGVLLLLLIALVNVASLLLVRAESRRREMAVRASLGASRGRILWQFLTEGAVLILLGEAIGLSGARVVTQLTLKLIPADLMVRVPYLQGASFSVHVILFGIFLLFLAGALFTMTPLVRLPKANMHGDMAEGGRWSAGLSWRRLGAKLVIVEFATAVVLLVSAGLLAKSFYQLLHVDIGFEPDHLATIMVGAANAGKEEQQIALGRRVLGAVAALPGVRSVALTSSLPVSCNCNTDWIRVVGKPFDGKHKDVLERDVSPDYFKTLGGKLLRGRWFTDAEDGSKTRVILINRAFARRYFPGEDPVGKQISDIKLTPKSIRTIIGVVNDVHEGSLEDDVWPAEYLPFNQDPDTYFTLVARSEQDERGLLPELRASIHKSDPGVGTSNEISLSERIRSSPAAYLHRSSTWLVGGFASLALILSVVGLYGVVAYSVSQRTREIGVRMALGAESGAVCRLVLKEAGWLMAGGIGGGLLISLGLSKLMRQLLFGVEPWDLATLAGVTALLAATAMIATFAPARRAAKVNPVDALRAE